MLTRSIIAAACLLANLVGAAAQSAAPADPKPTPADPAAVEQMTLQEFGAKNPACVEWNDACSTCKRDDKGVAHCSTPGIACQPTAPVCKAPAP